MIALSLLIAGLALAAYGHARAQAFEASAERSIDDALLTAVGAVIALVGLVVAVLT